MDNDNKTMLNREESTVINSLSPGGAGAWDAGAGMTGGAAVSGAGGGFLAAGTVLSDGFIVEHKLSVSTGEADLYICRQEKTASAAYVAKVYRRREAIKPEVAAIIKEMASPYIARVYATGTINGYFCEILPFYKYGSLQGKKFALSCLREMIVPCLNEGLKILHDNGIIHKDLKPSNIMMDDGQERVALIDFGISSMRGGSNTVILTQTGMTPEYSAPETFRNLYLEESDYYSLGITLYELYCGSAPFRNMRPEEIERYVSVQKIPFPRDMPGELQDLIAALTYYDITNRKDKMNPNRRWGYEEVKRWCAGEKMTLPGEGRGRERGIPPYILGEVTYVDKQELIYGLMVNWEEGKKQLFRGLLSSYFKTFDAIAAGYCLDAEEAAARQFGKEEILYWKTLRQLSGRTTEFFWRGRIYAGLPELGQHLLDNLRANGRHEIGRRESGEGEVGGRESGEGEVGRRESGEGEIGGRESGEREIGGRETGEGEVGGRETGEGENGYGENDIRENDYHEIDYFGSILENRVLSAYLLQIKQGGVKADKGFENPIKMDSSPESGSQGLSRPELSDPEPGSQELSRSKSSGPELSSQGLSRPESGSQELSGPKSSGPEPELSGAIEAMKAVEAAFRSHYKKRDKRLYLFLCAFMLTGEHKFILGGRHFATIAELNSYARGLLAESDDQFTNFCHLLLDEENQPDPQFEGWLRALGKEEKLEQWRQWLA